MTNNVIIPQGLTFRVNKFTLGNQEMSSVAALADGGFLVSWQSDGQDGSGYGVYARRYGADGSLVQDEFRINSSTAFDQRLPSATSFTDGGILVTWTSSPDGIQTDVYGKRFTSDGMPLGSEFLINKPNMGNQLDTTITALSNGNTFVSWVSVGQDGSGGGIYGRFYAADGSITVKEFRINSSGARDQHSPVAAALEGGGAVVVWAEGKDDIVGYYGAKGQIFDANGAPVGTNFGVAFWTVTNDISIVGLTAGGFVVSHTWIGGGWGYEFDVFSASGVLLHQRLISSNSGAPAVAALSDGGFVAVWDTAWDSGCLFGQRYDSSGVAVGNKFVVDRSVVGGHLDPTVTELTGGGFVVSWTAASKGAGQNEVYSRIYDDAAPLTPTSDILSIAGNSLTGTCAEFANAAYVPWTNANGTLEAASINKLKADGWTFLTSQTQTSANFFNVSNLGYGYEVTATGVIHNLNASALVARSADTMVLSITGTDSPLDKWLNWPLLSAQLLLLQPLFDGVYNYAATNGLKVIVTGHSMGAAMAQMFIAEYVSKGVEIEGVNFASPGYSSSVFEALANFANPVFAGIANMKDYFIALASAGHFQGFWNEWDPIRVANFFQRDFASKHDFSFSSQSSLGLTGTHDMELYLDIVRYVASQRAGVSHAGLPSIDTILRDYDTIVVHAEKKVDSNGKGSWVVGDATGADQLEGVKEGLLDPWIAKRAALFGSLGSDKISGYGKDDILFGGGGTDFLYGGRGKDILVGGGGGDVLQGDAGKDMMIASEGDTFVFTALSDSGTTIATADVIVGFNSHMGDKIDLHALGLVEFIGTRAFFDIGQVRIGTMGNDTTIEVNTNDDTLPEMVIRLHGVVAFSDTALLL